jgi:hypothetical protein
MSTVNQCGSFGTGVTLHTVCQIDVVLPSMAFSAAPFDDLVSTLSAAAVQPVRGRAGSVPPSRLISAAADSVPRLPASLNAFSRT